MERPDALQSLCIETAKALQGSARRLLMARTVHELGPGGQRRAERELGWGRMTMRQGTHERESGCTGLAAFAARGRKRVEAPLPHLWPDIRAMVESHRHAAPQCRTNRLSPRLRAADVRRHRSTSQGDAAAGRSTVPTITTTRNALGSSPKQVAQSPPHKTSQTPTPSSPRCTRSLRPRRPRTTSDASPGMPKPPSQLVPARVGARAAPWARRSSTMVSQRQRAPLLASASRPWRHSWCRA